MSLRLKIYNQKQKYLDAYSSFGFSNENTYLSAIGHGKLAFREIHSRISPDQTESKNSTYKKIGDALENVLRPKDGILLDGINNDVLPNADLRIIDGARGITSSIFKLTKIYLKNTDFKRLL